MSPTPVIISLKVNIFQLLEYCFYYLQNQILLRTFEIILMQVIN